MSAAWIYKTESLRQVRPTVSTPDASATRTLEDVSRRGTSDADPVPERIGRYEVQAVLGRGGMGTVYAARDPELERRVALKILHPIHEGGSRQTQARARLLREARALARVSHANVIHVYDVGVVDLAGAEDVFVAMELVAGRSLRAWMATLHASAAWAAGRAVPEVLAVMRQAALGLAAAHDAGLMHRDFKPDNALLGDDGVVRVVDFGLARSVDAVPQDMDSASSPVAGAIDDRLTLTGALMGTPAYMAPEQFRGTPTDARTDQFAFCATLYEALVGQRPFPSGSGHGLAVAVMQGELRPWPEKPRVEAHLVVALVRGLSVDPAERFGSMRALIAALDFDPRARGRRRWRIAAGLAGVAVSVAAGATVFGSEAEDVCGAGPGRIAEVWDAEHRAQLESAMRDPGVPYTGRIAVATTAAIDDYAARWIEGHRRACEATRVTQEQTEAMLDKRMVCLDRGVDRLRAVVRELGRADPSSVEGALGLVSALPPVPRCANVAAIAASVEAPSAAEAGAVADARARVQDVRAKLKLQRYGEARVMLDELEAQTDTLEFAPLWVEVEAARADLLYATGETEAAVARARAALMRAQSIGHDELGTQLANLLTLAVGIAQADPAQALIWSDLAEATAHRGTMTPTQRLEVLRTRAFVLAESGRSAKALEVALAAHEAALEAFGPEELAITRTASTVGSVLGRLGRMDEAEPYFQLVLDVSLAHLGDAHPELIGAYQNLGNVKTAQGEVEDARAMLEHAAKLAGALPDLPKGREAAALASLGNLLLREQKFEASLQPLQRSAELRRSEYGSDHPLLSRAMLSLGNALTNLDRVDDAAAAYAEVIRIRELLGRAHPSLRLALVNAGMNYVRHGRASDGLPFLRRAVALFAEDAGPDPFAEIEARYWLGRALVDSEEDVTGGLQFAGTAMDDLAQIGPHRLLEAGRAWLAEKRQVEPMVD